MARFDQPARVAGPWRIARAEPASPGLGRAGSATALRLPGSTGALFEDRRDAGRALAAALEAERWPGLIVIGLARGGVETAAEVARVLDARLDVGAVRRIMHPWQPTRGIGAVTPDGSSCVVSVPGLPGDELTRAVAEARARAACLDRRLHLEYPAVDIDGETVILVDDGLATGQTMLASVRSARAAGAARVVVAVPVAAAVSLQAIGREADVLVCLHPIESFSTVGAFYRFFPVLDDDAVLRLVDANRRARAPLACAAPWRDA